jgi:SAM-dependent methyltransferase
MDLPKKGVAIDYGCGNGIFTSVLKLQLPDWKVIGCDISSVSIKNAKNLFPECDFFVLGDQTPEKADFLFSHHVIEHVFDLDKTLREINSFLKKSSQMLHVFPCGNTGSLEHRLASLVNEGIDLMQGNRFHFEEKSHLRRLRSDEFARKMLKINFKNDQSFFSNQFYGSIRFYSQSNLNQILTLTSFWKALNFQAAIELIVYRFMLLILFLLQLPIRFSRRVWKKLKRSFIDQTITIIFSPIILLSYLVYQLLETLADIEWKRKKKLENGSELLMTFKRS